MQFEMPKPAPEHQKLVAAFAGTWSAEETIHPSPWDPNGGTRQGRAVSRAAMDGFFVITDYEQVHEGRVAYQGHGVFGYDPKSKRYSMHWFDNMGGVPAQIVWGTWAGDTLTFEAPNPMGGRNRYVYRFTGEGEYEFAILASRDGETWQPFMEARFARS